MYKAPFYIYDEPPTISTGSPLPPLHTAHLYMYKHTLSIYIYIYAGSPFYVYTKPPSTNMHSTIYMYRKPPLHIYKEPLCIYAGSPLLPLHTARLYMYQSTFYI